jgi:hypothetical protein
MPFDEDDNVPAANALLILVNMDSFFDKSGHLKNDILQSVITRLKRLEPKTIARLAEIVKCGNMKLFSANIAAENAFFDGDIFKEAMVEQTLTKEK